MRQQNLNEFFPTRKGFPCEIERTLKQVYCAQPFLGRHQHCSENCLDFNNIIIKDKFIHCNRRKCTSLPLEECKRLIEILQDKHSKRKQKLKKQKRNIKNKRKKKSIPLTQIQRKEIIKFQQKGVKTAAIAFFLGITPGQVRMNMKIHSKQKVKEEILFTEEQKTWLKKECSQSVSVSTFSAQMLLNRFKEIFSIDQLSVYQFRKFLRSQKIYYRVPILKPFHFFKKQSRIEEVHRFISEVCGYLKQGYKLIFIDECSIGSISRQSHKQWYLQGSFKQSLERVGTNTFVLAAMGEDNFLFFQVIEGTGKAFIFKHFCQNLLYQAEKHYGQSNFVFIMDNATIHKSQAVQPLLDQIPHVFTPPYRPDMNGIEHLFAWIKRFIVQDQPTLFGAFQQSTHKAFAQINQNLIESWAGSIYKHMLHELQKIY